MQQPQYNADKLNDSTSEISPNGGLTRWFIGLFALIATLSGLLVASRHPDGGLYTLGLVTAAVGVAVIVYTINTGFTKKH